MYIYMFTRICKAKARCLASTSYLHGKEIHKTAMKNEAIRKRWCSSGPLSALDTLIHQKLNGTLPTAIDLLDTQVFSGSVQWVLLEISWN